MKTFLNTIFILFAFFSFTFSQDFWQHMNGPYGSLDDTGIKSITINSSGHIFAGTDIGVYVSYDAGENWAPYGEGLPTVVIDDLKITVNIEGSNKSRNQVSSNPTKDIGIQFS